MVFHHREDDLIALIDALAKPVSNKVERLGYRAREDDLLIACGAEKFGDFGARALIRLSGRRREMMQPAMHIGIGRAVKLGGPIDHLVRLLRRRRIVQIDQRLAVHLGGKGRENPP
jgi:hypothetical protein